MSEGPSKLLAYCRLSRGSDGPVDDGHLKGAWHRCPRRPLGAQD